jgi:hypothetical protein
MNIISTRSKSYYKSIKEADWQNLIIPTSLSKSPTHPSSTLQLRLHSKAPLHSLHPLPRNIIILTRQPRTTPNRAHHHPILHNRYPTRNRHESSAVTVINAVRRTSWPNRLFIHGCWRAVACCGVRFVDCDVDGCVFRAFHACEGEEMACIVDYGDVCQRCRYQVSVCLTCTLSMCAYSWEF